MIHKAGKEIYEKSMLVIDSLLKENIHFNNVYSEAEKTVIKRVVHATSDVGYAESIYFTNNSVQKTVSLIKGKIKKGELLKIVCDSGMTKAGVSKNVNKKVILDVHCYIGLGYDILLKKWEGLIHKYDFLSGLEENTNNFRITKSAFSIRLAIIEKLPDIIAIGNAPTALTEAMSMCKYLQSFINYAPPVIVAMPVGFIGASESKKLLYDDDFYSAIGNFGNFGGSSSSASALNALLLESL